MPSVKRRASKILDEYGAAQSELIGKAVALTDGKAGTVENIWLDAGYADRALLSKHSNQMKSPTSGKYALIATVRNTSLAKRGFINASHLAKPRGVNHSG